MRDGKEGSVPECDTASHSDSQLAEQLRCERGHCGHCQVDIWAVSAIAAPAVQAFPCPYPPTVTAPAESWTIPFVIRVASAVTRNLTVVVSRSAQWIHPDVSEPAKLSRSDLWAYVPVALDSECVAASDHRGSSQWIAAAIAVANGVHDFVAVANGVIVLSDRWSDDWEWARRGGTAVEAIELEQLLMRGSVV